MRKERHKTKTSPSAKDAIHQAATSLFAAQGYAATSTREICERAAITKPVLYYHFGSKEQLYEELLIDATNEYRKRLVMASRRGSSATEKIVNVLEAKLVFTRQTPDLVRLVFRMCFAPEKGAPCFDMQETVQFDRRVMVAIVREGIKKGELQGNAAEIAEALDGISTLHILDFIINGKAVLDRSHAERQVHLLLHGCAK